MPLHAVLRDDDEMMEREAMAAAMAAAAEFPVESRLGAEEAAAMEVCGPTDHMAEMQSQSMQCSRRHAGGSGGTEERACRESGQGLIVSVVPRLIKRSAGSHLY